MGDALFIVALALSAGLWACAQGSDRSSGAPGSAPPAQPFTGSQTGTDTTTATQSDTDTDSDSSTETDTNTQQDPDSFPRSATDCKAPITVQNNVSFKPDCQYVEIAEGNRLELRLTGPTRNGKTGTLAITFHSEDGKPPELSRTYTGIDENPSGTRILSANYHEVSGNGTTYGLPQSGSAKFSQFSDKQGKPFAFDFDLTVTTSDDQALGLTFKGNLKGKIP